jgi:hypothetical protein
MPKVQTALDNGPEHAAFLLMQRLCWSTKTKWSDHEEKYPEVLRLARVYKTAYMKEYNFQRRSPNRLSYEFLEKISWLDIQRDHSRYRRLSRKDKLSGQYEGIKEVSQYYNRINTCDRGKRALHPDISPMSLGADPRVREWPSGKIEYKLHYYSIINKRRRKRNEKS